MKLYKTKDFINYKNTLNELSYIQTIQGQTDIYYTAKLNAVLTLGESIGLILSSVVLSLVNRQSGY